MTHTLQFSEKIALLKAKVDSKLFTLHCTEMRLCSTVLTIVSQKALYNRATDLQSLSKC